MLTCHFSTLIRFSAYKSMSMSDLSNKNCVLICHAADLQNHGDLDRVLGGIRQHVLGALNLRDLVFVASHHSEPMGCFWENLLKKH